MWLSIWFVCILLEQASKSLFERKSRMYSIRHFRQQSSLKLVLNFFFAFFFVAETSALNFWRNIIRFLATCISMLWILVNRGGVLEDVLGLEDVVEDTIWSPWPWPRRSSPRKLACPQLEDSTIFWNVKILWSAWKIVWKTFFSGDRLKNFCEDLFFFFFWRALALCVLGPWPWPRAFLSLASRASVLGKAVLGLGLGFFLCPWPWPRALCPRLHLC